ncbi:hypothetical protein [Aliamphritea hakodatensis]|uniref:hypothetical protein n=1 Tax=Aliamphritea hakodatensis TaxID=2895352 RepID=UPI0022FD42A9|nr:hypothetical protein [Aliamphritea hakodatensis]
MGSISFGSLRQGFTSEEAAMLILGIDELTIRMFKQADPSYQTVGEPLLLGEIDTSQLIAFKEITAALEQELESKAYRGQSSCLEFYEIVEWDTYEEQRINFQGSTISKQSLAAWCFQRGIETDAFGSLPIINPPESLSDSSQSEVIEELQNRIRSFEDTYETEMAAWIDFFTAMEEAESYIKDVRHSAHPVNIESLNAVLSFFTKLEVGAESTKRVIKDIKKLDEIQQELTAVTQENYDLKSDLANSLSQSEKLTSREKTTLLNTIGGLLEIIKSRTRLNQEAVIRELTSSYPTVPGLKESTLKQKFSEAKKILKNHI